MCVSKNTFDMERSSIAYYVFIRTFVALTVIGPQVVIGSSESLFASLSQLELLWQNDIDIVKTMEYLLKDNLPEYKPLKRYE